MMNKFSLIFVLCMINMYVVDNLPLLALFKLKPRSAYKDFWKHKEKQNMITN